MTSEVLLIHPPYWDPYGPPASTAALTGHLRANGVRATQIDLNALFFADRYGQMTDDALADFQNPDAYHEKVPHEHKVVLGDEGHRDDLLGHHGIDTEVLQMSRHRQAIATWDLGRLNVLDAIIHYGYFVNQDADIARALVDPTVLDGPAWRPLRDLFLARVMKMIEAEDPVVVGFSILGEQQLAATIACTHWLREAGYQKLVVWGGSDIRRSHELAGRGESWWRTLPDFLCLGEGESAILALAWRGRAAREAGCADWRTAVRLARDPRSDDFIGGLIAQPLTRTLLPAKRYEQVATLAQYDYDGFDVHDGYLMPWPIVPYQGSRGCHWGICTFCDHEEGYRLHYRPKSSVQVVDHMEHLRNQFGITHLQFVDEAIEPTWMSDLNDEIETRGLTGVYRWSNYSKIAKEVDYQALSRSYRNGCRLILFGVESFQQRALNTVRKGIRRSDIFTTLRDTHRSGIRSWIWLISGLPSQNPEDVRADITDLRSLKGIVDAVSVGRYRISANSDLYREAAKFGIVGSDLDHPMDLTYQIDGEVIRPEELAEVFYTEYYPTAIDMSLTHNRYLLFADAIKRENGVTPAASDRRRSARSGTSRNVAAVQASAQAGLGNI